MVRRLGLLGCAALLAVATTACAAGADGTDGTIEGDCLARVRYNDVVYIALNGLKPGAQSDKSLGTVAVIDCYEAATDAQVELFKVRGVPVGDAVAAPTRAYSGLYIREDLPRLELSDALTRAIKSV